MAKMDLIQIERIQNGNCPEHLVYKDPSSGLYGECFNIGGCLVYSDIPLCESLYALRDIIAEYDNWLLNFQSSSHDTETFVGMSNHNARCYWRKYEQYNRNLAAIKL